MLGGSRDAWGDPDTMLYLVELSNPTHDAALIVAAVNALPLLLADTPSVEPRETAKDEAFEAELAAQQAEDNRIDAWIDQQPEWGEHR